MINMKAVFALALMLAPMVGHAELSLDSLKEGAAKAAKAVGETTADLVNSAGEATGKAADAVTDTVDASNEALRDEATPEETRAKLDAMAKATLARLFEEEPAARELFDRSAGYGRGVAVDTKTGEHVYMKMATTGGGIGFGLGGFASQLVILFENDAAFQNFVVNGLDAGAEVGAMTGDEKERLALGFDEGKAVFVLTGKGWKVSAKLTGSRYWPDETLNDR
jgi:hypothetical protein